MIYIQVPLLDPVLDPVVDPVLDPVVDPVLDPVLDPVVRKLHDIYKARRGIISGGSFYLFRASIILSFRFCVPYV